MVYVQRDNNGWLLRVEPEPFSAMTDMLAIESEELVRWLEKKEEVDARLSRLKESDFDMVRVLEDVVFVLIDRGVIGFEDLPLDARRKLDERALARADLEGLAAEIDHGVSNCRRL